MSITKHNTFILDLLPSNIKPRFYHKLLYKIIKALNNSIPLLKFQFKDDALNRYFNIRYQVKENMLEGYQTNLEQAMNIYFLLMQVLNSGAEGDVVELGTYKGTTAILLQKTLDQF